MIYSKSLAFGLFILLTLFGCDEDSICEKGEGPIIREEILLPPIHSIKNNNVVDVYIQQGAEQKIIVEGQQDIIDLLNHSVNNGVWEIDFDRNCVYNFDGMKIFITIPEVRSLQTINEGNIYSSDTLVVEDISLLTNGRGKISLDAIARHIDARTESIGDIEITGLANTTTYTIRGGGNIRGFDLIADEADITIRRSGNVEITVMRNLKVLIDGSGDVYFKGSPMKEITIDGSGEVIDFN